MRISYKEVCDYLHLMNELFHTNHRIYRQQMLGDRSKDYFVYYLDDVKYTSLEKLYQDLKKISQQLRGL